MKKLIVILLIFIGLLSCENENNVKQNIEFHKPTYVEKEYSFPLEINPFSVSQNNLGGYSVNLANMMYFRFTYFLVSLDNNGNKPYTYKNNARSDSLPEATTDIEIFSDSSIIICNVYNIMEIDPYATYIHLYKFDKNNKLLWDKKIAHNAAPLCKPLIVISSKDEILIAFETNKIDIIKLDKNGNKIWENTINNTFQIERFWYAEDKNLYLEVKNGYKEGIPLIDSKIYKIDTEIGDYTFIHEDVNNDSILFQKDFYDISFLVITDTLNNCRINAIKNKKNVWETKLFSQNNIAVKNIYRNEKNEIYIIGDIEGKIFIILLSENGEIIETKIFHEFDENYETIHSKKHVFMIVSSKKKDGEQLFNTLSIIYPSTLQSGVFHLTTQPY